MTQKLPEPLRHPTGKPMESTRLTGLLLPFKDGAPLFVHMPGSDGHLYLPVFTSTSALSAADAFMHFEHDSTKVIADGKTLTRDLGGSASTTAMGDAIAAAL